MQCKVGAHEDDRLSAESRGSCSVGRSIAPRASELGFKAAAVAVPSVTRSTHRWDSRWGKVRSNDTLLQTALCGMRAARAVS